jgi:hypothetical protein
VPIDNRFSMVPKFIFMSHNFLGSYNKVLSRKYCVYGIADKKLPIELGTMKMQPSGEEGPYFI